MHFSGYTDSHNNTTIIIETLRLSYKKQSAKACLIAPSSCSSSSADASAFATPYDDCSHVAMNAASSFHLIGDYIGMESCVDLTSSYDDPTKTRHGGEGDNGAELCDYSPARRNRWRKEDRKTKMKEYPPPIPLLARTGNLHSHMPWVLRRRYTCDGRLILTEEKVRHHEYFRAHRTNGRLTLQLVPLDDDVLVPPIVGYCDGEGEADEAEPAESLEPSDTIGGCESCCDRRDGEIDDRSVVNGDGDDKVVAMDEEDKEEQQDEEQEDETAPLKLTLSFAELVVTESGNGGIGSNGSGKCWNFNNVSVSSTSSCIFGVPVPAL